MKILENQDLINVITIGRAALEWTRPDELRSGVLCLLEQLLCAEKSIFSLAAGPYHLLNSGQAVSRNLERKYFAEYNQHYFRSDPFLRHLSNSSTVLTLEQVISLKELLRMIENCTFTNCFFSSMHASNYFAVRGTLPQDKERMIGELERVIKKGNPFSLRPEFLRGL